MILTGRSAERFEQLAKENYSKKSSIDFTKEVERCKRILDKAKL